MPGDSIVNISINNELNIKKNNDSFQQNTNTQ
jgi:hypothetical protein